MIDPKPYIYLAGPMTGLTFEQAHNWRAPWSDFVKMIEIDGYVPLSPTRDESFASKDAIPEGETVFTPTFDNGDIHVQRDLQDINQSAVILMNMIGAQKVSIGSIAEMGYAYSLGKPIVLVMEPEDNPHEHVFTTEMANYRTESLRAAVDVLHSIRNEVPGPRQVRYQQTQLIPLD
jgi:nucleoside 2-deoxyribosyltransferase